MNNAADLSYQQAEEVPTGGSCSAADRESRIQSASRALCDVCDKHPWAYTVVAYGLETNVCDRCYGGTTLSAAGSPT